MSPKKGGPSQKGKNIIFQPSIFRVHVSFRVCVLFSIHLCFCDLFISGGHEPRQTLKQQGFFWELLKEEQ